MLKIRPLSDWTVVKCEPIQEKIGSIVLLHGRRIRFAEVLAVGPGRVWKGSKFPAPTGLAVGDRIAFFRETLETQQGKEIVRVLQDLGDDLGLIRAQDVLFVVAPGAVVEAS